MLFLAEHTVRLSLQGTFSVCQLPQRYQHDNLCVLNSIFESWNLGHLACDMCKQNSSFFFCYLWNLREYDEALCGRSIKPIRQEIIRRAFCNQRIHTDPPNSFRQSLGRSSQSLKSAMIQLLPRDFSCILQLSPEMSGWKIWFGNEAQILSLGPCRSS